jgi:hypothetical protein
MACGVAFFFMLVGCSAPSPASPANVSVYHCKGGRSITVREAPDAATVEYGKQRFELTRRPSTLAVKYASAEATLMIDGDFASFVSEAIYDLQGCRASGSPQV